MFALVYLLLVGFIDLRAYAMTLGVALDWNNHMVLVTGVASPWLLNLAVAALSGLLVFWFLHGTTDKERHSSAPQFFSAVFALLVLLVCIIGFSATKDYSVRSIGLGGQFEAQASPVLMWAQAGALSPATHAVAAVLAVLVAIALNRNRAAKRRS